MEHLPAVAAALWRGARNWMVASGLLAVSLGVGRAEPVELVSPRAAETTGTFVANGDSIARMRTPDGRFVLFSSSANNVVTNDDGQFAMDVFLHDRTTGASVLVSANTNGTAGGNGHSQAGMVSSNGRFVVFESAADNLVPNDTNELSDVFLRDLQTRTTHLLSVGLAGRAANGPSRSPVVSQDGRYVAFVSGATNLVAGDTNRIRDVFWRDRTANSTRLVGRFDARFGAGEKIGGDTPVLSADGQKVLFFSPATNLVASVPISLGEVYLRDFTAGTTNCVSRLALAAAYPGSKVAQSRSFGASMTEDGRRVVFRTTLDGVPHSAVVFRDLQASTVSVVETNAPVELAGAELGLDPVISADGLFVAHLRKGTAVNTASARRWSVATKTGAPAGEASADGMAEHPVVSADGRFVVHALWQSATGNRWLRRHDFSTGTSMEFPVGASGAAAPWPLIAADGLDVVWNQSGSTSSNLYEAVYSRRWDGETNALLSAAGPGLSVAPEGGAQAMVSPGSLDGRWVAFSTLARADDQEDAEGFYDVFVHDRFRHRTRLISRSFGGGPALGGHSLDPVLSGNGRYVFFGSLATNLTAEPVPYRHNLFRHDLHTGETRLVNEGGNGYSGSSWDATSAWVSHDGRFVAYFASITSLRWRDLETNASVVVSDSVAGGTGFSMGTNGQRVAYAVAGAGRVWDAASRKDIFTNATMSTWPVLSPDGKWIVGGPGGRFTVLRLAAPANSLTVTGAYFRSAVVPQAWSHDGAWLVYWGFLADSNNVLRSHVRLLETATGQKTLVSRRFGTQTRANGGSDQAALSADGRFVVYRSTSTDLTADGTPGSKLVLYSRETGENRLLAKLPNPQGMFRGLGRPIVSRRGDTILFDAMGPFSGTTDRNRAADVHSIALESLDRDEDGMWDGWEEGVFGGLNRTGLEDWDKDGTSDRAEFFGGTDARDAASVFRVWIEASEAGGLKIRWPVSPESDTELEARSHLGTGPWVKVLGERKRLNGLWETGFPADGTNQFYRVRLGE